MSATRERDRAARIAGSDNAPALRIARNIDGPWSQCQALAYVAWSMADHDRFSRLLAESLDSGWSIRGLNRSVTVIAWPVDRPDSITGDLDLGRSWHFMSVIDRSHDVNRDGEPSRADLSRINDFQADPGLLHGAGRPEGGKFLDFHRVGKTHIVVVTRQDRPWPPDLRRSISEDVTAICPHPSEDSLRPGDFIIRSKIVRDAPRPGVLRTTPT